MTTEITFTRLQEDNDWEGERWNFWIQLTGNEAEIMKLAGILREEENRTDYELPYQLHPYEVEPESVVDKLVEYADPGYMDSQNKITGVFTCPDYLGEDAENLYKGGITQYFKNDG